MSPPEGDHHRRHLAVVLRVRVGDVVDEYLDRLQVATVAGEPESRAALRLNFVHFSLSMNLYTS